MKSIDDTIRKLSPSLLQEVLDFAQFLLEKQKRPKQRFLSLSWAGGLKAYRDRYTSLDLQQKALEWWGD